MLICCLFHSIVLSAKYSISHIHYYLVYNVYLCFPKFQMDKKKYGLIIKGKEEPKKAPLRVASVFGDDDDDDGPATETNATSASVIRVQKAAEREHQKAEAEDPTIFDYDGNYDAIQEIKNEKVSRLRVRHRNKSFAL